MNNDDTLTVVMVVFVVIGFGTVLYLLTLLGSTVFQHACVNGKTFRIDGTHYECVEVYKDKKGE